MIRRKQCTIFTDAKESATLYEVKKIIEGILKIIPENQKLYKDEAPMTDDNKTLGDYGFTSATARAQAPATMGLTFKKDGGFLDRLQQQQQQQQQLQQQQGGRVVDLSHTIGTDTLAWPGFPGVNFTNLVQGRVPAGDGYWIEANWFSIAEHSGTHLDAPAHFLQGGEHLHELPVERFFGPAVLVDGSGRAAEDPDYQLGTEELLAWEKENGQIPEQSVVLVHFGWDNRWPDK
nr:hypothetical protein BaRGS_030927 [Batillaria attramentaria]